MSLSVKVLGCNGFCGSCYENKVRERNKKVGYDIAAIRKTLREESVKIPQKEREMNNPPCIHGGEPLLMELEDLDSLLSDVMEIYGRSSIQTNGIALEEPHIELFKKHKTGVGFSLDGDTAELNLGRWNSRSFTKEEVQRGTDLVLKNIGLCVKAGISTSVICLLRRYNAGNCEKIEKLTRFLRRLYSEFGIADVRTNQVIVYDDARIREEQLTEEELSRVFVSLAEECFKNPNLRWRPYRDVVELLMGNFNQTCVFSECDIWKTRAEMPIDADGNVGNCLKGGAAIEGIQALAAETRSDERYIALNQTPQEYGGCAACRYWVICKGGCPGEGIDNDWRNRSRFCGGLKSLYGFVEGRLRGILPKSKFSTDVKSKQSKEGTEHGDAHMDTHGDSLHGDHLDVCREAN